MPDTPGTTDSPQPTDLSEEPTLTGVEATVTPPDGNTNTTWPGDLRRLADRYQLEEPIASGGAAIVWRAFDDVLSRSVAIKLLHPHLARDPDTVERFRREAINAARLTHPNVVAIYDTGQEQDLVYLVMEFVDGPSLKDVLADHGQLEPATVAALGEQVAGALGEAHAQGIVHRDVKPANILLTGDGVAKVTDFGIAKAVSRDETTLTSPGTIIGTAAYVAPEQLDTGEVDARADVYALGVVLHECLTGQPAFRGDTPTATAAARLTRELLPPRQVRADVPRALDEIVVRSTRRDPTERYPDAALMARAFTPLVRSRPSDITAQLLGPEAARAAAQRPQVPRVATPGVSAPTGPDAAPTARRSSVRRVVAAAFGALTLAALALVAVQALGPDDEPAPPTSTIEALPVVAARDFDPFGDPPSEHPDEVALAHDEDPATVWLTEQYRGSPVLGGLKPGVGVWFDLGDTRRVRAIELQLIQQGTAVEVYASGSLPEPVDGLPGWGQPLASFQDLPVRTEIDLPQGATGRYWLVWLTRLPAAGDDQYQGGLAEVRFLP